MPSWDVIAPHVGPVLVQMAIFLVAVGLINHLILKPFSGSHSGREKRIADTRSTAERETELSHAHRGQYDERVAKARADADARRQEIRGAAQAREQEVLAAAFDAADEELTRARESLSAQVASARASLAHEARGMAREMASKVLGRAL